MERTVEISSSSEVDSFIISADTEVKESIVRNTDGSFADFIYSFAADKALQLERILFPLPYNKKGEQTYVERESWAHDSLFLKEPYYTLLYDNEEDMELEKNMELDDVTVEWLSWDTNEKKQYKFKKEDGEWMLVLIEEKAIDGDPRKDFLTFFGRFSADSLYQRKHIASPLKFITSDPDDEFQIIETTMDANQWFAFKPLLPLRRMSNIDYGQKYAKYTRNKVVDIRGIGNGFCNILYFKRTRDGWNLARFEDLSN